MAEQKEKAVAKLLASGVKLSDIDTNGDGSVSDDELSNYVSKNPTSLLLGGSGLVLWWLSWQLKQRASKSGVPVANSAQVNA
jgi:hypothetical protein